MMFFNKSKEEVENEVNRHRIQMGKLKAQDVRIEQMRSDLERVMSDTQRLLRYAKYPEYAIEEEDRLDKTFFILRAPSFRIIRVRDGEIIYKQIPTKAEAEIILKTVKARGKK